MRRCSSGDVHVDLALKGINFDLESLGLGFEFNSLLDDELVESLHEIFDITLEIKEVLRCLGRIFVVFILEAGSGYEMEP